MARKERIGRISWEREEEEPNLVQGDASEMWTKLALQNDGEVKKLCGRTYIIEAC